MCNELESRHESTAIDGVIVTSRVNLHKLYKQNKPTLEIGLVFPTSSFLMKRIFHSIIPMFRPRLRLGSAFEGRLGPA